MSLLNAGTSSPTPSNASSTGAKRKRPLPGASTPSQQTSGGNTELDIRTEVHFAIEELKKSNRAYTFQELGDYLSLQNKKDPSLPHKLNQILMRHPQVEYDKTGFGGKGSFRYKPKYGVRSAEDLRGFLQRQKASLGISVKDLKDGWPDAIDAINELEKKGELLVNRHRKDGTAKTVWQNDPTLMRTKIEDSFKEDWHKIPLPANPEELRSKLVSAGLKPTSAPREPSSTVKPKEKKKKAVRKSGKQTNTHMAGILRDYSHKRK